MKATHRATKPRRGTATIDDWERSWQKHWIIQCSKIGPFPIILMDAEFWMGLQRWGRFMMEHGVFTQQELGFGRSTDSPQEAVGLIVSSLPPGLRKSLRTDHSPELRPNRT